MNTRMRRFLALMTLTLSLIAVLTTSASATHSAGYHWGRTANPFTLKLGDNVSATWDPHLATAATDWSASTMLNTVVVAGSSSGTTCARVNGRVEVCSAAYGNTGWLGLFTIWTDASNHLTAATIKLNDTYFNSAPYNTAEWRQHIICQYVGRSLGLNLQDTITTNANLGTCMDATNLPSTNQHPNAHDFSQLVSIYTHLDAANTVFGGGGATTQSAFDTTGQWGNLISASVDGHTAAYLADFGGGIRRVTFVTWAQ